MPAVLATKSGRYALLVVIAAAILATTIVIVAVLASVEQMLSNECDTSTGGGLNYSSGPPSELALGEIPEDYLKIYQEAVGPYNMDWAVLAGVGFVETNHGANKNTSSAGAQGPMQFMPETWASIGVDGNGDGNKDVLDPADAIPAAAKYLNVSGAPDNYNDALQTYNGGGYRGPETAEYANKVLGKAEEYRTASGEDPSMALLNPSGFRLTDLAASAPPYYEVLGQLATGLSLSSPAFATMNEYDLVDDGDMTMKWVDYTKYDSAMGHAESQWNELGAVSISKTSSDSEADVIVADTSGLDGSGVTRWSSDGSDKHIYFDTSDFDDPSRFPATDLDFNKVATHEVGHALGFAHPVDGPSSSILYQGPLGYDTLQDYDVSEYRARWGEASRGTPVSNEGGGGQPKTTTATYPIPYETEHQTSNNWGGENAGGGTIDGSHILVEKNTPVVSVTEGKVVSSERSPLGGWSVLIEATKPIGPIGKGDKLFYSGLAAQSPLQSGQEVKTGDEVGKVGMLGSAAEKGQEESTTGLHFGWYVSEERAEMETGAKNPAEILEWLDSNGGEVSGGGEAAVPCKDGAGATPASSGTGAKMQGSTTGMEVVEEAKQYIGVPYLLGGTAECVPGQTMDCTCLTLTVFGKFGVQMPDYPMEQWNYGTPVEGEPQAGDLLIWGETVAGTGGHAGIALGNGEIIHANMATMDTSITPMFNDGYMGARRLVNDGGESADRAPNTETDQDSDGEGAEPEDREDRASGGPFVWNTRSQ